MRSRLDLKNKVKSSNNWGVINVAYLIPREFIIYLLKSTLTNHVFFFFFKESKKWDSCIYLKVLAK